MSTKEAREKEAKKLKYRKMGFGPMMDSGEIDFGDGKKSSKKSFEHPMAEERFQQTAKARLKKSGLEDSEIGDPRTDIKDYDKKEQVYHSRDGNPYLKSKVGEKIHKAAQKQKQEAYAPKSPRNEKMAKGGLHQGYGAARTSGMGLQDESIQPGKVQKAFLGKAIKKVAGIFGGKKSATMTAGGSGGSLPSVTDLYQKALDDARMIKGNKTGGVMKYKRGSGLDLPVINSVKPTVNKTKRAQNLSNYKIQFNKQKSRAGVNPNSHFDKKNANVVKHTRVGGPSEFVKRRMKLTGPFSSMDEMRQAKGFKPGESNTAFLKRRMDLRAATKVVSATKIGKIALGVGAAGVAASQYLKSKMKKNEPEKKMGGGMMQGKIYKASEGIMLSAYKRPTMSIQEGAAKARERNKKQDERKKEIDKAAKKYRVGGGGANRYGPHKVDVNRQATEALLGRGPIQEKIIKFADKFNKRIKTKKMVGGMAKKYSVGGGMMQRPMGGPMGGMMQRPMGYKHGTKPGAGPLGAAGLRQPTKEKSIDQIIKDQKFPPISIYIEDKKKPQKPFPVPSLYNNNKKPSAGRIRKGEPRPKKMGEPIGFKSGTMVKARGCKLGRTRPTKMY